MHCSTNVLKLICFFFGTTTKSTLAALCDESVDDLDESSVVVPVVVIAGVSVLVVSVVSAVEEEAVAWSRPPDSEGSDAMILGGESFRCGLDLQLICVSLFVWSNFGRSRTPSRPTTPTPTPPTSSSSSSESFSSLASWSKKLGRDNSCDILRRFKIGFVVGADGFETAEEEEEEETREGRWSMLVFLCGLFFG